MSDKKVFGMYGVVILFVVAVSTLIGGFLWPYTIEGIASMVGNDSVAIAFWQGALIGFVPYLGQLTIPAAIIVWFLLMII